LEILAVLAERPGELVTKDTLMNRVWPGAIVEENTLQVHISAIRRSLGADGPRVQAVSGRGYRLYGTWAKRQETDLQPAADPAQAGFGRNDRRTNLPAAITPLLGRSFAAAQLARLLSAHRLVTLTGPGGIGKTALALEVARTLSANATGDAYVVDLASVSNPDLVASAIAGVTDVRLGGEDASAASVARALMMRQMLLVLDNCEHVIGSAAEAAESIIRICPGVTLLATSREDLRVEGEIVYRVSPLSFPQEHDQDPDAVLAQSAVQLFIARIASQDPAFVPETRAIADIAAICRQLDGIPLAIEFAAARAATLGLNQVAARLDDRFGLLTTGRRTALPRHQTLRATLDWSYDLLTEWERQLLCRSAIFPAGFTAGGAMAVTRDLERPNPSMLDGIGNLVAKSLITFDGLSGSGRWRQLETTRAYSTEKLVENGEIHHVTRLALEFLRDLFKSDSQGTAVASSPEKIAADRRDIDNVRWAIDRALSSPDTLMIGLELTAYSASLWFRLSLMFEYRQRVERALDRLGDLPTPDTHLEMRLHTALGYSLWYSGPDTDPARMQRSFDFAGKLAKEVGDADILFRSLWGTWASARGVGEHDRARAAADQYAEVAGSTIDKRHGVLADRMLALTLHDLGDHIQAGRHARSVIDRAPIVDSESNNDLQVDAHVAMLTTLARIQWVQGLPDQAKATVQDAIDAALKMDHWFSVCYVLFLAGCPVSLWIGDQAEAELRIGMLRERTGGNPGFTQHAQIFSAALELRRGGQADQLKAAYIEPRIQYATMAKVHRLIEQPTLPLPYPESIPSHAPWSLPEVLRVDAEILIWREGPSAFASAEAKLLDALEHARRHSALSWELRIATSLARIWSSDGRTREARSLLRQIYGRFNEGFQTEDLRAAAALLENL
jgi:predicted ATPase